MSNVIKLVRPSNVDSIVILKSLLRRAVAGELAGVALCSRSMTGADEVALTGVYADSPDAAISASVRLTLRLNRAQDEAARR